MTRTVRRRLRRPLASSTANPSSFIAPFLAVEGFDDLEYVVVEELQLSDAFSERDHFDLVVPQGNHVAELALVHSLDCTDTEASRQHSVVCSGRAAALDVPKDRHARLDAGA